MIDGLIRVFLRFPLLAIILAVVVGVWGWKSFVENPKDAIPDIAETQTIVFSEWAGRSPKDVDEQVTYPLTVALQGVPRVREIRATSGFGWSVVYVVFDDDADFYWGRSRVLERLNSVSGQLPEGVTPTLGPDATPLGQVFWYTVENGWYSPQRPGLRFNEDGTLTQASRDALLQADPDLKDQLDKTVPFKCPITGADLVFSRLGLDELRSIQDFDVKLALESTEGVSETASIGGYVRQYQIDINPEALRGFDVSLAALASAVRNANVDVGAKVIEQNGTEILVRGIGFLGGKARAMGTRAQREKAAIHDIENIVVKASGGTPIYLRQLATVTTGPDFRRGALDKLGAEAVGGCVVMRFGENPLSVIDAVKDRIALLEPGLQPGVRINAFYDRTTLINKTMGTLTTALWQELVIAVVVVVLFLLHVRSSIIIGLTLPLAVLFAFICMQWLGLPSNIMSLAGIAIAIGTMIDMGIVMTENIYQYLTDYRDEYVQVVTDADGKKHEKIDQAKRAALVTKAASEVGSAIVTAIATTVISFMPVFFLEGQAAKLFTPLVWTKTFCMVGALLLALTIVPPFAAFLLRGKIRPIQKNPLSRLIRWAYEPTLRLVLRHKIVFLCIPFVIVVWGFKVWLGWLGISLVVTAPFKWLGLDIASWSLLRWISIVIGFVLAILFGPPIIDTITALVSRGRSFHDRHWGKRNLIKVAFVTVFVVFCSWLIEKTDFVSKNTSSISAVLTSPPNGKTYEAATLGDVLSEQKGIGQEFMPPLDEGDFLYMPSVLPAGSITTVMDVMRKQDIQFGQIPEVDVAVGKLGRIDSSLDPAPLGMLETAIMLRPRDQWPLVDDAEHDGLKRRRTMKEVWSEIKQAGAFPGVTPSAELQPIRTRVEMLSTGLNAKIGVKIYGDSVEQCESLAVNIEQLLRSKLKNAEAINAVRTHGKPYLEIEIDREQIARYGVNIADVQNVIEIAIGGMNLTTTYEGLDRYPVRIRYQRELRDSPEDLGRILVATPSGAQIPMSQLASIKRVVGPMSIKREGAKYVSYVTMNNVGVDETTLVNNGKAIIDQAVIDGTLDIPDGHFLKWTGSYERNLRAKKRLAILIPLVLLVNLVLIYLQFKRFSLACVVFLAIPVAFAGGFIFIDYWPAIQDTLFVSGIMDSPFEGGEMYLTVAVWVGFIALFGIAVDDGIVLGTYITQTFSRQKVRHYDEIVERVVEAGLRRIRPCLMTSFTTLAALTPVLLSTGRGSDVMTPMALPVFGGMFVVLISLFVVPVCYCGLKQMKWRLGWADEDFERDS